MSRSTGTHGASRAESAPIYSGWWVLSATFACAMLVIGSTIYAFQLFVLPVEREFGLSRTAVNQGMSLFMIGSAIGAPFAGRVLDRFPAPAVFAAGGLLVGGGMATIASTSSLTLIAFCLAGPMALGAMLSGGLANTTTVARWFERRRGRALGIATVSSGAGGFVMVQLIAWLIERSGWRGALAQTGGLLAFGIGALALCLIRTRPSEAQLQTAGERVEAGGAGASSSDRRWTFRELIGQRNFWCIGLGTGLLMASDQALLSSKMPYLLEIGIEPQAAAFLIACMTASSVAGKIGIGLAADHVDLRRLFGLVAGCHVLLMLALIAQPGYWGLLVAVSLFGVGVGGVYPMLATLTAASFGSSSFGSVAGTMQLTLHPISIALLTWVGFVHDRTGAYTLAFWTFIVLVFVATALIRLVRLPRAGETAR